MPEGRPRESASSSGKNTSQPPALPMKRILKSYLWKCFYGLLALLTVQCLFLVLMLCSDSIQRSFVFLHWINPSLVRFAPLEPPSQYGFVSLHVNKWNLNPVPLRLTTPDGVELGILPHHHSSLSPFTYIRIHRRMAYSWGRVTRQCTLLHLLPWKCCYTLGAFSGWSLQGRGEPSRVHGIVPLMLF